MGKKDAVMAQDQPGSDKALRRSTILTTLGVIAAAFGAAACCALPILLASLGIGTAWLGGIAGFTGPHQALLMAASTILLAISAVFLWRMQSRAQQCGPDGNCAPPWVRIMLLIGLFIGALLLAAGYFYV